MRLHPAKDGLIPEPDERGMTRRDMGGNRLVDVNSPKTGYCTGVRSPLTTTGQAVIQPTPAARSGVKGPDVRFDQKEQVYYDLVRSSESDPIGIVVRTVADGDDLLKCARIRVVESTMPVTGASAEVCNAPVRKAPSARKANDEAVAAILSAMGYKGKITREIRKAALDLIAIEKGCQQM